MKKISLIIIALGILSINNSFAQDRKKSKKTKKFDYSVRPVDREVISDVVIRDLDGNIISDNRKIVVADTSSRIADIQNKPIIDAAATSEPETTKEPEIFDRAEVMPQFPGGVVAMMKYLKDKLIYPSVAKENGLEGKVIVKFYIDTDGSVKELMILKDGVGGGAGEEALRLVNNMPKWSPATQRGKPVKAFYTIPVMFRLDY